MSEDLAGIQQEIIALSHEWMKAVGQRDEAVLDRIIADDFLIAGWLPDGKLGDKQFYIEDCLKPVDIKDATYSYDQWNTRIYGNMAIVNCRFECHALIAGKEWGGAFLFTDVWAKRNGWQVLARHSSPVFSLPSQ
jgi:hypothetical protein